MSSADEIGRLAWMTPQSQAAALAGADASRPFDLAVDYFMGMPAWTVLGDPKYDIWLTHTPQGEGHEYAGTAISMYSHVGTHICSLNHIGRDGRFFFGPFLFGVFLDGGACVVGQGCCAPDGIVGP